jgi:copper chaperone CopZ
MDDTCEIKAINKTPFNEEKQNFQVTHLSINGLNCPNCAIRVRNALLNTYGVTDTIIDHIDGSGEVTHNPDIVERISLIEIVSKAGGGRHRYSAKILN